MVRPTRSFESLGQLPLENIMTRVGAKGTSILACTGRSERSVASDDHIWSKFCADELRLHEPVDHLGNNYPNFMAAYQAWRMSFDMYPWPLVIRIRRFWDQFEGWLAANFPESLATLRPGATENEINDLEVRLGVVLPIPTRVLYRFHDGQQTTDGRTLGLIGGYEVYDVITNVFLLSIRQIIEDTIIKRHFVEDIRSCIIFAKSFTYLEKFFLLDCDNSNILVGTMDVWNGEMLTCHPTDVVEGGDGMLVWLEEHVYRLSSGYIGTLFAGDSRRISLLPNSPLSVAVTDGIKISASAVFVPEFCNLLNEVEKFAFVYSIRMSLLPDSGRSGQLQKRYWIIYANNEVVLELEDEGVVGEFPKLSAVQSEYVYQSFVCLPSFLGSMSGFYQFIPGSIQEPEGSPFDVQVAPFPLEVPDFIY